MDYYLIGWILVFFLILFVEGLSQQLIAVWFAVGAVVAIIAELMSASFNVQLSCFVIASIISLLLLRPYVKKATAGKIERTNSDENIGKTAVVIADFDAATNEGRVMLSGLDWAAKSLSSAKLLKGEQVTGVSISGVKLLVSRKEEE